MIYVLIHWPIYIKNQDFWWIEKIEKYCYRMLEVCGEFLHVDGGDDFLINPEATPKKWPD